jgi:LPXTG-motif cell wall-anchored protein
MRIRSILAGGLLAVGLSAIGIAATAGPASAHDLNGGSAQRSCRPGDGVDVTWTFTSSNAAGHHIVAVDFNRPVLFSSFTADTVMAKTSEVAGHTVSLKATATFEDQFVTSHTVTTTIPTDACPASSTTVPPTTTTNPTSQLPPVTIVPPTTVPAATTAPTTSPPPTAPVQDVTPTPSVSVPRAPVAPTTVAQQLPATGTDGALVLVIVGISSLLLGAIGLFAVKRAAS